MAAICQTSLTSGETISDVGVSRDGGGGLTATGLICGSCGAHSSSTGKFCSECGARLTQATRSAEYKQVTVLFADVVRSMDIAATLDMERLREIMTEVVERSAAVAQRYGGTVEHTGDGVMAIFGAPVALEDHAFRACVAALAIQEEIEAVGGRGAAPRRCGAAAAGRSEFGPGDRRRHRFWGRWATPRPATRRVGAADGIGGPAGRGDAVRVDRSAGRARRVAG